MVTESMLCIKNGKELFGQAQVVNVIIWLVIQILVSIGCVYGVVLHHWYFEVMSFTYLSIIHTQIHHNNNMLFVTLLLKFLLFSAK